MVGFCLDTCHAHAGGIALETAVDDVRQDHRSHRPRALQRLPRHFDSGADRHANIGAGTIDADLLAGVVRDAGAPILVETPGGPEEHNADFDWLRERLCELVFCL